MPTSQDRSPGRTVVVRRAVRTRGRPGKPAPAAPAPRQAPVPAPGFPSASTAALAAVRRLGESAIIAVVASSGLYLVGSVYTDAYYRRLSIEVTSLDLAPPYVALQASHALQGLLAYPTTLLLLWVLYRTFAAPARRLRGWFDRARQRCPRLLLVLANLVVVAPLLIAAFEISYEQQAWAPDSVLSEAAGVLWSAGLILLGYAIWLAWSRRASIVSEVRARRPFPIALVFLIYLLTTLAATAEAADNAATLLMTGTSDGSMGVVFTTKAGALPDLAGAELVLVTARNGAFYVVERQPFPPSQRPTSYVVPFASVDAARVQRLTDADATLDDLMPVEVE